MIKFEIPFLPKTLNDILNMHFRDRKKYNDEWYNMVHLYSRNHRASPDKPFEFYRLKLTRVCRLNRAFDYDNLVGSFKAIVDGLRYSKIIKDDKYANSGQWDVSQIIEPKPEERIIIEIEERK